MDVPSQVLVVSGRAGRASAAVTQHGVLVRFSDEQRGFWGRVSPVCFQAKPNTDTQFMSTPGNRTGTTRAWSLPGHIASMGHTW